MEAAQPELLIQATAVAVEGKGVVIIGPPGSGKSELALTLIDRGATLIGDDGVCLRKHGEILFASPPPNIRGKFEIRNVGIVDMPTCSAPVGIVLELEQNAPRFIESPEVQLWLGYSIPKLRLDARTTVAAIKAEYALQIYGLAIASDQAEYSVRTSKL